MSLIVLLDSGPLGMITNPKISGIVGLGRDSTEFRKIILASVPAKLLQLRGEHPLSPKPSEWAVTWKRGIASGFELDLALDWKSPNSRR